MIKKRGLNKLNKLQIHLAAVLENCKEKSVKLSKFEKIMFSSVAAFIFVILATLLVSGVINAAYPYAPAGGLITGSATGGNVPENSVMSFNRASCPAGWVLADGTGGTPDLTALSLAPKNVSRVRVSREATQLMSNGLITLVEYNITDYDSLGEYNDSYQFVAKNAGYYGITASVLSESVAWDAGEFWFIMLYKNGTLYSRGNLNTADAAVTTWAASTLNDKIYLNVGEYLDIRLNHDRGADTNLFSDAYYNYFTVDFLGQTPAENLIYCVKTATDSPGSNSIWQTLANDVVTLANGSSDFAINNSNFYVNVSSGNVGIGTSSPSQALEVNGKILTNSDIAFGSTSDYIDLASAGVLRIRPSADLIIAPAGEEKVRITSEGKVGIGTESPDYELDLEGGELGNVTLDVGSVKVEMIKYNGLEVGADLDQTIASMFCTALQGTGYTIVLETTEDTSCDTACGADATYTTCLGAFAWYPRGDEARTNRLACSYTAYDRYCCCE